MKSLLFAVLTAFAAYGQLWTVHVRDGVQMAAIMSCGGYTKQPDCLMVHVKQAVPVQRILVTVHVDPAENNGVPWVWQWIEPHSPWSVAVFEKFACKALAIDMEGYNGDQSVWWVSFPMR
jgi:hypothetical protein